jgi:hypothetical protein
LANLLQAAVLWFWGHEHQLAIYPQFQVKGGVAAFGRRIGHGGMPVDLPPALPKYPAFEVEFVDERTHPNDGNLSIGFNGFAQLTLSGDHLAVEYVDLTGSNDLFAHNLRKARSPVCIASSKHSVRPIQSLEPLAKASGLIINTNFADQDYAALAYTPAQATATNSRSAHCIFLSRTESRWMIFKGY